MSKELINNLITLSIVLGFICNATLTQFFPELRTLFISSTLILGSYKTLTFGRSKILIYILILILTLLLFNSKYYILINSYTDNAYFYCLILGILISDNIFYLKKIMSWVIIINLLIMIYEIFKFEYFINIVSANKFEIGRYQGLFSYSKEASYFLVISFLLFRHLGTSLSMKLFFLISSIFTGSRTSIIFIVFILVIDFLLKIDFKIIFAKQTIKYFFYSFLFLPPIVVFFNLYFIDNFIIYNRIMQSFDFQSSGHLDRIYYHNQYINYFQNYNFVEFFIGKGSFVGDKVGNGSENTWLTLFAETVLIVFLIYLVPILYISFLSTKNFIKYYPFILLMILMLFGRIALGWADGILLWSLIFYIIYFNKKGYEKNYIHTI